MAARTFSPPVYLIVYVLMMLLTVLNVGLSFVPLGPLGHLAAGLGIAACTAALGGLFFMHVVFSPRITWIVILVSIFWLVAVLMALTYSDYFTRDMIPFMPGH